MIAHCVQGSGFKGVANYLATGKNGDDPERVAWSNMRNVAANDLGTAAAVMRHTANQSTRCKKPVYHMSISWPEGEKVSPELMQQVAERTIADMGLAEHQAMIVAHNDTDHQHLHIVANRIHPETGKAWSASHDRKRVMQSLRAQEKELGLQYVPNKLTDPEMAKDQAPARSRDEAQRQRRLGLKALPQMDTEALKKTRADLARLLEGAKNWRDFDEKLAAQGLRLEAKGRGHVVTDGKHYAKFSSVGSKAERDAMADRFGSSRKTHEKGQRMDDEVELDEKDLLKVERAAARAEAKAVEEERAQTIEYGEQIKQYGLPFDGKDAKTSAPVMKRRLPSKSDDPTLDRIKANDAQVERLTNDIQQENAREHAAVVQSQKLEKGGQENTAKEPVTAPTPDKKPSKLDAIKAAVKARKEREAQEKEAAKEKGHDLNRDPFE